MIIITAGEEYNDIDTLACAVAHKRLMDLKSIPADIVLPGPLNESVTKSIKAWGLTYKTTPEKDSKDPNYVLVDISNPEYFAKFVDPNKISAIYDHHHGFEDYWKTRLGDNFHIELIGACATLIWEEFKREDLGDSIGTINANLLYTAILSNTLNLKAQITSSRDIMALEELHSYTDLPQDWRRQYFDEVSQNIMNDPVGSMTNDTKVLKINGFEYTIIQLELWDSKQFVEKYYETILKVIRESKILNTFLTCPSISEGVNYLVAMDNELKKKLNVTIGAEFIGNIGKTKKLWLRKEIMRLL